MKVFQINTVCGVGSTGRIATDLYHVLKRKGIPVVSLMAEEKPRQMWTAIK